MPSGWSHNELAKGKSVGDRIPAVRSVQWTATAGFGRNPIQAGLSGVNLEGYMQWVANQSDSLRYAPPRGVGSLEYVKSLLFMLYAGLSEGKGTPSEQWARELARPGVMEELDRQVKRGGFRNLRDWVKFAERTFEWWVGNINPRPTTPSQLREINETRKIFRVMRNA